MNVGQELHVNFLLCIALVRLVAFAPPPKQIDQGKQVVPVYRTRMTGVMYPTNFKARSWREGSTTAEISYSCSLYEVLYTRYMNLIVQNIGRASDLSYIECLFTC